MILYYNPLFRIGRKWHRQAETQTPRAVNMNTALKMNAIVIVKLTVFLIEMLALERERPFSIDFCHTWISSKDRCPSYKAVFTLFTFQYCYSLKRFFEVKAKCPNQPCKETNKHWFFKEIKKMTEKKIKTNPGVGTAVTLQITKTEL